MKTAKLTTSCGTGKNSSGKWISTESRRTSKNLSYFIDLEDLEYSPDRTEDWIDGNYSMWGLQSYWEPHW